MNSKIWTKYVPIYKWDNERGLLIVMKSGEELPAEEVDPGYNYYRRQARELWSDGDVYEIGVSGPQLVRVRPTYFMVAPYYEGSYDFHTAKRPLGTYDWYVRFRLGQEMEARPAIWVIQKIHDHELYWLTVTEYPEGRVIVKHELAPKDIELFAKVCPNPPLDDWHEDAENRMVDS